MIKNKLFYSRNSIKGQNFTSFFLPYVILLLYSLYNIILIQFEYSELGQFYTLIFKFSKILHLSGSKNLHATRYAIFVKNLLATH